MTDMRKEARQVIDAALRAVLPDNAVQRALRGYTPPPGRLVLVALGKAAWQMAAAASACLGDAICDGIVITKYGHAQGPLPHLRIREAGHPMPDHNSFAATAEAIGLVRPLTAEDGVLLLISGGGSALFEKPLCTPEELTDMTAQLLRCGADIVEINTLRKRVSAVKGGRFAQLCAPARVFSIVLSDIVGDPLDMIASGPAYPDRSTAEQARAVVQKYGLRLSPAVLDLLGRPTPGRLDNVQTQITGSVRELCAAAARACADLGYEPRVLTASLGCEAREAGRFLASIAQYHAGTARPLAFLAGGETVVHVTGRGAAGATRNWPWPPPRGSRGCRTPWCSRSGPTGRTAPPTLRAAWWTARPARGWRPRGCASTPRWRTTTRIPRCRRRTG